ncbi:hypothetical protein PTSG_12983 [Salpingoeca rosetta]|uniref:poly(A)-specific ribonuclease n=1 Tax=Salpingoeca rosetta (strain ATCC 50818 / BSB-021) TaxID=946362 RepID=F2UPC9_SALR5|nr:uncharacterized protein PTSG_12983 [Salpingoeca rosetta]EGD79484.1 hypothetical protein PTSG_12983 [Salpingoeca rosetta]|eukprot:XP_004988965.1 hypothetical protein PTSG_12983 [Salpingoeca rosetta]
MSRRPPIQTAPSRKMGQIVKSRPPHEAERQKPTWRGLDLEQAGIVAISPALFQMQHLTHLYLARNRLTTISPEIRHLRALRIVDLSYNRLRSIPPAFGDLTELNECMLSGNELSTLPFEFGKLYQIKFLALDNNPWTEPIASHVATGTEALMQWLLDQAPTGPSPPDREWIQPKAISRAALQPYERAKRDKVSVFCYNILCDKYASRNMFKYCPSWALAWEYRKGKILTELANSKCDILCLQEVSKSEFYQYFLGQLQKEGYHGAFKVKTRAAYQADETIDGCATFYSTKTYKMLYEHGIDLQQLSVANSNGCNTVIDRCMPKDNVALFTVFEHAVTKKRVFVANLHLTWDPHFSDVKVVQIVLALKAIREFLQENKLLDVPVMLMGDFNSMPDSGVYEFLATGKINPNHPDMQGYDYKAFFDSVGTTHPFKLRSAYTTEMQYTNKTAGFVGIIDYIWYTEGSLLPQAVWGPVDESYMDRVSGCPNPHFSSDHLALGAKLYLKS